MDPNQVPFLKPMKANANSLFTFAALPTFGMTDEHGKSIELDHMDSLRLDVLKASDEDELLRIANEFLKVLISTLRVFSVQWWIGQPYAVFVGDIRNVFSVDNVGMPLGPTYSRTLVRTFGGFERPITPQILAGAFAAALVGKAPNLSDEFFLDAALEEARGNYRKVVMDCAICCELERDNAFKKLWGQKHSQVTYRRGKVIHGNDLALHLDRDVLKLTGRSLRVEQPALWDQLRSFWLLRGAVVHGEYQQQSQIRAELDRIGDAREITRRVVLWLRTFAPSASS